MNFVEKRFQVNWERTARSVDFIQDLSKSAKIIEVLEWGPLRLGNSGNYFNFCPNLTLNNVIDTLKILPYFASALTFLRKLSIGLCDV